MSRGSGGEALRHGSAVSVAGRGVLILGASGSGKSGLALAMMALGARLVADDQVVLRREAGALIARAPARLAGLVEARGVGLIRVAPAAAAKIALAVDLDSAPAARMPQWRKIALLGVDIDLISGKNVPHLGAILTILAQNGIEPV